jgi:hypothetical protein
MAMQWILTWARTAFSRKNIPPPVEHAAFDSQTEAVNFAMSLDYPQRRTVRLHLPGGDIAELASHRTNVRALKRTNKSAGPRQPAGAAKEARHVRGRRRRRRVAPSRARSPSNIAIFEVCKALRAANSSQG